MVAAPVSRPIERVATAVEPESPPATMMGRQTARPDLAGDPPPPPLAVIRRRPRSVGVVPAESGDNPLPDSVLATPTASRAVRSAIDQVVDDLADLLERGKK